MAGANASALLYSLIECANVNEFEPYPYLRHVFTDLPKAQSLTDVEPLVPPVSTPLPWNEAPSEVPFRPCVNQSFSTAR